MSNRGLSNEGPPPEEIMQMRAKALEDLLPVLLSSVPEGYCFDPEAEYLTLVRTDPHLPDHCEMVGERGNIIRVPAPLAPWIEEEAAKAGSSAR